MTTNIQLSEKQQEIVFAENSAIYVKGSAGSGKTRVLTERLRYLLTQTKKRVLVLTFTYKTQEEIKKQLHDIPAFEERVFVVSFNFLCNSMLDNHGHLIGITKITHILENETDRLELVEQAIKQTISAVDYQQLPKKEQRELCDKIVTIISQVKLKLIPYSELEEHFDKNLILLFNSYQDILRAKNAVDFDDLLYLAYKLLVNYPNIAGLYRRSFFAICVDEAQELNNAQYQFLVALANGDFTNIIMLGDPNQDVIDFDSSSPKYMNELFVRDFNPIIFELNENYRSSKAVLSAVKTIFPDADNIPGTVKEGIFEIQGLQDENYEAQWVVDKIKSLIDLNNHSDIEGDISYHKIAVLARNKYVFNALEAVLIENKLPFYYKIIPGTIHFESDLMKIFELALRVKLNPQDSLHKNLLLKRLKLETTENLSLELMIPQLSDELNKNLITLVVELTDNGSNLESTLESFRDSLILEDENEKYLIINDINYLLKQWHHYAKNFENKSLYQFKNVMALGQSDPFTQTSGIRLSTVHTMKAQEFDIVFIIGMDDETFPDYRAVRNSGIDMIQEKNNLYVAFTRAKRFLYVTWPQKRKMPWGDYKLRKISRFLEVFND